MRKLLVCLFFAGLVLPSLGRANTALHQLQEIEAGKIHSSSTVNRGDVVRNSRHDQPKKAPVYELVLFMQARCIHCQRFDPVLKEYSEKTGLPVFAYTLDGSGAYPYENAVPAPQSVIQTFFGQRYAVATPTLFLVKMNKKAGIQAYPVFQGEATYAELSQQVARVMNMARGNQ